MMQTEMVTLTDFLLARIMEDEAELGVLQTRDESAGPNGVGWAEVGAISEVLMVSHTRMLAECEAKRRIVDDAVGVLSARTGPLTGGAVRHQVQHTLRLLTLPYDDHPDYREEWRQ